MTTSNNDSVANAGVPAEPLAGEWFLNAGAQWRPSRRELPLARDSCGLETIIEQHLDPVLQGEYIYSARTAGALGMPGSGHRQAAFGARTL